LESGKFELVLNAVQSGHAHGPTPADAYRRGCCRWVIGRWSRRVTGRPGWIGLRLPPNSSRCANA